jgi:hypothetical protein
MTGTPRDKEMKSEKQTDNNERERSEGDMDEGTDEEKEETKGRPNKKRGRPPGANNQKPRTCWMAAPQRRSAARAPRMATANPLPELLPAPPHHTVAQNIDQAQGPSP